MRINRSLITFLPDTGAGSGTVTSVALTAPNIFFVLGTPITTSGTLQLGLVNQLANTIWAGPISGAEDVPTFRSLVSDDIPNLDISKITSGTLGVDKGGSGATSLTGILVGNGTSPFTALASSNPQQMLRVNTLGTGYEWFTPSFLAASDIIATTPLVWNSGTKTISLPQANNTTDGYLSSADWLTFSSKQPAITLTTLGDNGPSTFNVITGELNVPEYTLVGLGGFVNPMTTTGDLIVARSNGEAFRLGGNFTTTRKYLSQIGDGTAVTSSSWQEISAATIGAVPSTRQLTINGTTQDLSADRTFNVGTVTSVAISVPSAFSVSGSPITSSGTLAITGAGTASQYIRGDGQLSNFPTGGSGGGASVNYYLNGSVSQGTFGGVAYYQMSKFPVAGAGTNFTRTNGMGNGYIASFITDAGDPGLLNIPGGNWNLEFYFNSSSTGGAPQFYAEIYVVDTTNTFTLIASGVSNPETITNGTAVDQYFTSVSVPQTTLLITDRIAVRIYVITDGRSITLHTENGNLSEIVTTFSTGLTALNGLTDQVQFLSTGTAGTDFNISSAGDTHTFNIPTASNTKRGLLATADFTNFTNKMDNPFTAIGQLVYSNAAGLPVVVQPNVMGDAKFLVQFGDGTNAYAPFWGSIGNEFVANAIQIDYDYDINGVKDGTNTIFSTSLDYSPNTTKVYVNGLRYTRGTGYDYEEMGFNQIQFYNALDSGDIIIIEYVKL